MALLLFEAPSSEEVTLCLKALMKGNKFPQTLHVRLNMPYNQEVEHAVFLTLFPYDDICLRCSVYSSNASHVFFFTVVFTLYKALEQFDVAYMDIY